MTHRMREGTSGRSLAGTHRPAGPACGPTPSHGFQNGQSCQAQCNRQAHSPASRIRVSSGTWMHMERGGTKAAVAESLARIVHQMARCGAAHRPKPKALHLNRLLLALGEPESHLRVGGEQERGGERAWVG